MASNNTMSILEAWSAESGELVDLQQTGALCVGWLLDRRNLVAGGCVLQGTEDRVHCGWT